MEDLESIDILNRCHCFTHAGVYTFGLQKGSNLTKALNTAMLQLGLTGVLDGLHKKWIDDLNVCSTNGVSFECQRAKSFSELNYLLKSDSFALSVLCPL